jgi:hypothetical protein
MVDRSGVETVEMMVVSKVLKMAAELVLWMVVRLADR